ncbi:MAG: ATP-binding cassette domain-containing protein [Alphaproteobacteria bacterium]|nr:ATP-binding cassette domain-containing protein [Alphaproteobacteria bacterium]
MIELDAVALTLRGAAGPVNVLRGIDLSIGRDRAVAVVGPSGSGKSTLLAVIAGLERPSAGRVRVDGQDLTDRDEDALALFRRRTIGIVFQAFHLIPTMTALENVAIPLEFAGREDALDRARAGLAAVGLGHRIGHYPSQLSGGEQQRVALARAFAADAPLILADEPTGNLDSQTGLAIADLLFETRRKRGATLVLITHEEAMARRCDRVLRLADGRIVDDRALDSPLAAAAGG